jgi:hypothetical protein
MESLREIINKKLEGTNVTCKKIDVPENSIQSYLSGKVVSTIGWKGIFERGGEMVPLSKWWAIEKDSEYSKCARLVVLDILLTLELSGLIKQEEL